MRESLRLVTSGYNRPRYDRIGWKVCACRSKKKYYSKLDPSKGVDSTPTRSRRTLSRVFPLTPCITCRMNKNVDTLNDPSNLILRFEYNRVVPFFHQQFLFLLDSLRTKFSRGTKRLKTGERLLRANAGWRGKVLIAGLGVGGACQDLVCLLLPVRARKLAGQPRKRFLDSREDAGGSFICRRAPTVLFMPLSDKCRPLSRDYTCPYKRDDPTNNRSSTAEKRLLCVNNNVFARQFLRGTNAFPAFSKNSGRRSEHAPFTLERLVFGT